MRDACAALFTRFIDQNIVPPSTLTSGNNGVVVPVNKLSLSLIRVEGKCLELASIPLLYLLVKAFHIQADIIERGGQHGGTKSNSETPTPTVMATFTSIAPVSSMTSSRSSLLDEEAAKAVTTFQSHQLLLDSIRWLLAALQVSSVLRAHHLIMQTVERIYNTLLPLLVASSKQNDNIRVILPVLVTCYHALTLVKEQLSSDEWPLAISRISTRLCYHIVDFYTRLQENDVAKYMLTNHLSLATIANDNVRQAFEKAKAIYDERKKTFDQVKLVAEAKVADHQTVISAERKKQELAKSKADGKRPRPTPTTTTTPTAASTTKVSSPSSVANDGKGETKRRGRSDDIKASNGSGRVNTPSPPPSATSGGRQSPSASSPPATAATPKGKDKENKDNASPLSSQPPPTSDDVGIPPLPPTYVADQLAQLPPLGPAPRPADFFTPCKEDNAFTVNIPSLIIITSLLPCPSC
jgi:hypothetical protein